MTSGADEKPEYPAPSDDVARAVQLDEAERCNIRFYCTDPGGQRAPSA
jgi:hypothetical protein